MGIGGISIWQLLIILAIIVLIFGTKKLKNMGGDIGGAVKGFKKAMSDEDAKHGDNPDAITQSAQNKVNETEKEKDKV